MRDLVLWVLQNCTGYHWGWLTNSFDKNLFTKDGFDVYYTLNGIIIGAIMLINIIYFIFKAEDYYSRLYIPIIIFYLICNFIMLSVIIWLATIFGVVAYGILIAATLIFLLLWAVATDYTHACTIFGLLAILLEYSEGYNEYRKKILTYKKSYNTFINENIS
jgi:hypothetical protein